MGKKKKTHEEFVAQVYAKAGDEYTALDQYVPQMRDCKWLF